jgi:hypothetical protein
MHGLNAFLLRKSSQIEGRLLPLQSAACIDEEVKFGKIGSSLSEKLAFLKMMECSVRSTWKRRKLDDS